MAERFREITLERAIRMAYILGPSCGMHHALADQRRRIAAGEAAAIYLAGSRIIVGPRVAPEGPSRDGSGKQNPGDPK